MVSVGTIVWLSSELMFFAGLFAMYFTARAQANELVSFLTPIAKGLLTELAVECTYHAQQILGGHGYIQEWGLEQYARDARITTIYEGTTAIQANDLIGRKVAREGGSSLAVKV